MARRKPERDLTGELFVRVSARLRTLRGRLRTQIYLGPTGVIEPPEVVTDQLQSGPLRDLLDPAMIEVELERLNGRQ